MRDVDNKKYVYQDLFLEQKEILDAWQTNRYKHYISKKPITSGHELKLTNALLSKPDDWVEVITDLWLPDCDTKKFFNFSLNKPKSEVLFEIRQWLSEQKLRSTVRDDVSFVLDELLMNIYYSAIKTDITEEEKSRIHSIIITIDEDYVGLIAADSFGKLDVEKVMHHLNDAYEKGIGDSIRYDSKGAGIGLAISWEKTNSILFATQYGLKSVVAAKIPKRIDKKSPMLFKNLHLLSVRD